VIKKIRKRGCRAYFLSSN